MFRAVLLVLFALTASVSAAPIPKDAGKPKDNSDRTALQGEWKLTSIVRDGKPLGANANGATTMDLTWTIQGDSVVMGYGASKVRTLMKMNFDADIKARRITFTEGKRIDADGKPVENGGAPSARPITYTIENNTLIIEREPVGNAGLNTPKTTMTFTRVKK